MFLLQCIFHTCIKKILPFNERKKKYIVDTHVQTHHLKQVQWNEYDKWESYFLVWGIPFIYRCNSSWKQKKCCIQQIYEKEPIYCIYTLDICSYIYSQLKKKKHLSVHLVSFLLWRWFALRKWLLTALQSIPKLKWIIYNQNNNSKNRSYYWMDNCTQLTTCPMSIHYIQAIYLDIRKG